MNDKGLFSDETCIGFAARVKETVMDATKVPLTIITTCFQLVVLVLVGAVEWEIIYRLFQFLSEDYDYWSPEVMAVSAVSIIAGFHILEHTRPDNLAVRFVNGAVVILISVYMAGVGLLVVSMLDLPSLIDIDVPLAAPGEIPLPPEESWIEWVFADVTTPLSVLFASLGLGGLVIINVFVAHHLITWIVRNLHTMSGRLSAAKQAVTDHQLIKRYQKDYARLQQQCRDVATQDDSALRLRLSAEVLRAISAALWPHKQYLSEQAVNGSTAFAPDNPTNAKQIAKVVTQIEAINQQDILHHIRLPDEEQSS